MALLMKKACERCETTLAPEEESYIRVYECAFCAGCTGEMQSVCPNCGGELVRRPRPKGASQIQTGD